MKLPSRPGAHTRPPYPEPLQNAFPDRPPVSPSAAPAMRAPRAVRPAPIPVAPAQAVVEDCTPRRWSECFEHASDIALPGRKGTWRVYDAGLHAGCDLAIVFLHGGGQCALSWALVAEKLKGRCGVVAFDARGHGDSQVEEEGHLSAECQVADAAALIPAFLESRCGRERKLRLVVCGHSMGGAIAVRLVATQVLAKVVGLVVIDVVEGTAMSALPYMTSWLQGRPVGFGSVEAAVRYVVRARHVRNAASARMSVPAQVVYNETAKQWVWRTDLENSVKYWPGWFQGLSKLFLSLPVAKMLVLANVDRLDRDLMIAQMQGKFQNILIPAAGHTVHEDQPESTAQVILDYLERNLFLSTDDEDAQPIFQQRHPIPPRC